MKLTLSPSRDQSAEKHRHLKISVEDEHDDLGIEEMIGLFRSLLLAAEYDSEAVRQYLGDE